MNGKAHPPAALGTMPAAREAERFGHLHRYRQAGGLGANRRHDRREPGCQSRRDGCGLSRDVRRKGGAQSRDGGIGGARPGGCARTA